MEKNKLKDKRTMREFAVFWRNMYKHHDAVTFYYYKDGVYLGIALRDMGFEMDSGKSYCKKFGTTHTPDLETLKRQLPDMDMQLLGNLIYSKWREWNHWREDKMMEEDYKWFVVAFERLVELTDSQC